MPAVACGLLQRVVCFIVSYRTLLVCCAVLYLNYLLEFDISSALVYFKRTDRSQAAVQGLLVKMITGDQALIGRETAKQLGMGNQIFNTEVLLKVGLTCILIVAFACQCAPSACTASYHR